MNVDSLRRAFKDRAFTRAEAASVLGLENPDSTLGRLKATGRIERLGRGTYRLRVPEAYADVLEAYWEERVRHLWTRGLRVALDGPDAARIWTEGAYNVGEVPGSRIVYLAVDPRDAEKLAALLRMLKIPTGTPESPPPGTGLKAVVRAWPGFGREMRNGVPVVRLGELRRLATESPLAYDGLEEWLIE